MYSNDTHKLCATAMRLLAFAVIFGPLLQGGDGTTESVTAASVKPNRSGDAAQEFRFTPGRLTVKNMTLRNIIKNAYRFREDERLQGTPAWVDTERFDIVATSGDGAPNERLILMLQSLLAQRFHLAAHHEMREMKCYTLEIAPGGPKVRELKAGVQPRKPRPEVQSIVVLGRTSGLVTRLSIYLGTVVIDRTGLSGSYDLTLELPAPEAADAGPPGSATADLGTTAPSWNPAIFTALREQLGLNLAPTRTPVDVLVLDHIERPSEN